MDKEIIIKQEGSNDGRSIFLYYDSMAGVYLAYGLSAYYTTLVMNPYMSYSEEMQMPVALLRKEHILYLRQSTKKAEHRKKDFYKFELKGPVGDAGYEQWAQKIFEKHNNV